MTWDELEKIKLILEKLELKQKISNEEIEQSLLVLLRDFLERGMD